jgi:hypothetical protein
MDAQVRRQSITLLCVWVSINPVLEAARGTSFVNPVEGSLLVSLRSSKDLEISQVFSGSVYASYLSYVTCLNEINLYIHHLAEEEEATALLLPASSRSSKERSCPKERKIRQNPS